MDSQLRAPLRQRCSTSAIGSRASSARLRRRARSAARTKRKGEEDEQQANRLASAKASNTATTLADDPAASVRLEDDWNVKTLQELRKLFGNSSSRRLTEAQFIEALRPGISSPDADVYLRNLLYKIQESGSGITWDEFASYMILEYQKKDDAYARSKEVSIVCPATSCPLPHRSAVNRIRKGPNGNVYLLNENGTLSEWQSGRNTDGCITLSHLSMSTSQRSWVTDFVLLPVAGKLVLASGERELWVFDSKTLAPAFVITQLEEAPMRMQTLINPENNASMLVVGDHVGALCSFSFPPFCFTAKAFKDSQRQGKLNKIIQRIPLERLLQPSDDYGGISYTRWAVHNEWVSDLIYIPTLRLLASTCNADATAMVVGEIIRPTLYQPKTIAVDPSGPSAHLFSASSGLRRNPNERVFKINKGAKTVVFSDKNNLLITGGLDRHIRLWNPHVDHRASGTLKGHSAPIVRVAVDEKDLIFSLSSDLEIRIWDMLDMSCLTILSRRRHCIPMEPSYMFFDANSKTLILTTENYHTLSLAKSGDDNGEPRAEQQAHTSPVIRTIYNQRFQHLISADVKGSVKVWDVTSGALNFEFNVNDTAEDPAELTDAFMDASGRRLMTTQSSGYTYAWNYNNGQLLRVFDKGSTKDVIAGLYVQQGNYKTIVVGGWDNRMYVFKDSPEDDLSTASCAPLAGRWKHAPTHTDNITCMAACPPNIVATASYDGAIYLWNMTSATVFCRLQAPNQPLQKMSKRASHGNFLVDAMLEEGSSTALLFLSKRQLKSDTAGLVSGSARGIVSFWSYAKAGRLLAQFPVSHVQDASVTCLATCSSENSLVVSDNQGWIQIYDIRMYHTGSGVSRAPPGSARSVRFERAMSSGSGVVSTDAPPILQKWRAHLSSIQHVLLTTIQSVELIATSSRDGVVRLWDMQGSFIAALGQAQSFNISQASTWLHPDRPADIVAFDQEEEAMRLARENIAQEMRDLGIYDDIDESPSNDLESIAAESRIASARPVLTRPSTQRRPSNLATIPSCETVSSDTSSPSASAKLSSAWVSERPSRQPTRPASRHAGIFELRRAPRRPNLSAKAIVVPSSSHMQSLKSELSSARALSAPVFQRLVDRSQPKSGNWARHLQLQPHRLARDKIYQALPYHELEALNTTVGKPVVEDRLSFI
eukprot:TRINITY_DN11952_c0_g1_i7.p1 TRINITY_DN11952_c0_g1~~TRINITY_DN11952_c0_g1_i7.p1  ORF type:complete len:1165 (+),score=193.90 TRINITY_DN11952_c0_g1_i7:77-3571(+)